MTDQLEESIFMQQANTQLQKRLREAEAERDKKELELSEYEDVELSLRGRIAALEEAARAVLESGQLWDNELEKRLAEVLDAGVGSGKESE